MIFFVSEMEGEGIFLLRRGGKKVILFLPERRRRRVYVLFQRDREEGYSFGC